MMLEELNVLLLAFCIPVAKIIRLGNSAVRILGRISYLKFKKSYTCICCSTIQIHKEKECSI